MTDKNKAELNRRDFLKKSAVSAAAIAAPLTSSLWLSGCGKQQRGGRPNVVMILIDTLRPDYLGFYGYKKEMASFLAKLTKDSAVFMRAFATSSWTAPSTASLFTSKYPHQHGVIQGLFCHNARMEELERTGKAKIPLNSIPTDLPVLPGIFKSMGYTTFGMAANPNISDEIGFNRGFDRFELSESLASMFYERMQQWKEEIMQAKPFFLYLHPNDVHKPYHKRNPYYEEQKDPQKDSKARYLSEIGYVDEYIGKIYEMLNLDDNTIFVVISDHGEEFWDHGSDNHRAKLYRELTQVLMMLHAPFLGIKTRRIGVNVSLVDVLPTMVELVNGKPVPNVEGVSLAPLLRTGKAAKALSKELRDRMLFAHRIADSPERQLWAVIYQHWNLIEQLDLRRALFNHRRDLKEKHNVFFKHPKVTSQLLAELYKFKKHEQRKTVEEVPVDLDENLLKTLKSLGYVE